MPARLPAWISLLMPGEAGKGVVLTTPGWQCEYPDVWKWQPRVGRPFTCPLFSSAGGQHLDIVKLLQEGNANGANVWPQVTPRPLTMQFTLADAYNLNTGEVFGELIKVSRASASGFDRLAWDTKLSLRTIEPGYRSLIVCQSPGRS